MRKALLCWQIHVVRLCDYCHGKFTSFRPVLQFPWLAWTRYAALPEPQCMACWRLQREKPMLVADQTTDHHDQKCFTDSIDLHQLISESTFNVRERNQSLFDLMFTNTAHSVLSADTSPPVTDHCPVIAHTSLKRARPVKSYKRECFLYSKANISELHEALGVINIGTTSLISRSTRQLCCGRNPFLKHAVPMIQAKFFAPTHPPDLGTTVTESIFLTAGIDSFNGREHKVQAPTSCLAIGKCAICIRQNFERQSECTLRNLEQVLRLMVWAWRSGGRRQNERVAGQVNKNCSH